MYYLNQEVLKKRYEQFCSMNLLGALDQIYQDVRVQFNQPNSHFQEDMLQPDCFQTSEIFAFSQQSQVLFEAYGAPTCVAYYQHVKRHAYIGTAASVILCIEIINGRADKIEAIFNYGDNQNRYGAVTSMNFHGALMVCGFARGDVQVFEVHRKWDRLCHVSRCHKSPVIQCLFVGETKSKYDTYEVLSMDDGGRIIKHNFYLVTMMDKWMMKSTQDTIYENGKCKSIVVPTSGAKPNIVKQSSSWWDNAKSMFKSENGNNKDTQSERSSFSFVEKLKTEASVRISDEPEEKHVKVVLDMKMMPQNIVEGLELQPSQCVIVAIEYRDRVELVRVIKGKAQCELIYVLKRNNLSLDQEYVELSVESGELSWGEGYFKRSFQNAYLLMVRWGDAFHLVKLMSIEGELEIVEGAILRLDTMGVNILCSQFLTNNIIYVVTDDDWVGLIHTTQFEFIRQEDDFIILEQRTRMLSKEEIEALQPEIRIQYSHQLYQYSEVTQVYSNGIISLRKGRMYIERLQTWEEFLDALVQKNQWFKALFSGMLIYQGQLKIVAQVASSLNMRQSQMRDVLQKVAFTYIMFLLKPIDIATSLPFDELCKQIKQALEFLIKTDNTHFVLTVIKDFFKNMNQLKLFFQCLESFILEKQIPEIPDSFLMDFIQFYTANQQKDVISKLILQLDLKQQDPTILLKTCMDQQLYRAMIYLCNKQGDYITALIKLMDLWDNKMQEENKCKDHIGKDKLKQERIRLGHNILAYVRMCQKGVNIQGEKVPSNMLIDMLRGIIIYLFNSDNLKQFLMLDVKISLQLLGAFMRGKLLQLIVENDQVFNIMECPEYIVESHYQCNTIRKMIQLIYLSQQSIQQMQYNGNGTTLEINHHFALYYVNQFQNIPFKQEFKLNVIRQVLDHQFFDSMRVYNDNGNIVENDYENNKNAFVLYIVETSGLPKKQICQLPTQVLPELDAYLYYVDGKYDNMIQQYLSISNTAIRFNVFEVLESLLNRRKQLESSQQLIIQYSNQLIAVHPQTTYRLLQSYLNNNTLQLQVSKSLESVPDNQLHYIKLLITSNQLNNDAIKLTYLDLLCQRLPKEVLPEIQLRQYPLDESLLICKKYKIIDAMAHILQKTGAIQEALDMLSQLFFGKLRESHKAFAKSKLIIPSDKEEILQKLSLIMQLCVTSQKNDETYESLWYQFLENFFKEYKLRQLTDNKVPAPIRELLCAIVSEVFLNMSKNVDVDILIDKLHQHYGPIPVSTFIKTNNEIRQKFEFESSTFRFAMAIVQQTYGTLLIDLQGQMQMGLSADKCCILCQDSLAKCSKAIVFQCGHSYHQECYIEVSILQNQRMHALYKCVSFVFRIPLNIGVNQVIFTTLQRKAGLEANMNNVQQQRKSNIEPQPRMRPSEQDTRVRKKHLTIRQLQIHDNNVQQKCYRVIIILYSQEFLF